jgi:hypothetical protein
MHAQPGSGRNEQRRNRRRKTRGTRGFSAEASGHDAVINDNIAPLVGANCNAKGEIGVWKPFGSHQNPF